MQSHDLINTGNNRLTAGPKTEVGYAWKFETDGGLGSSPAVVDGTLFIGSNDGSVYALDMVTGDEEWTFETGGAVESSPAVLNGTVYAGSNDHRIYALGAETGEKVWQFETGDRVRSSPAVEADAGADDIDDVVAIGSDDGSLYILDAVTGEEHHILTTGGPVVSAPMIIITRNGWWEVGVGNTDGSAVWWVPDRDGMVTRVDAVAPIYASISAPDLPLENIWYRAHDDGTLSRFDRAPYGATWTFEANGSIRTTPVHADDLVYVGSRDANVYAVNTDSGEQQWAFETGGEIKSTPAIADGVLYVGSGDNHVYAIDTEMGDELWSFRTGGSVNSSPAVVNGTVFVGSDDGSVYAITSCQ